MKNPWATLPAEPPFVLPSDEEVIASFNRPAPEAHRIHLEIVPEPFLGNPAAPVVLLNLNPGFVDCDDDLGPRFHDAAMANLQHSASAYAFYLLDPELPPSPGRDWWLKKLRALIGATSLETVASRVFVLETHGYHSRRYSSKLRVPSQDYTLFLLRRAIERRSHIVIMRGLRLWRALVPELGDYARLHILRNVQNPTVSPGNFSGFDAVVAAVAGVAP